MENLTFAQNIIKQHTVDPLEGYTVVVVESIGGAGEEFRFEIEPGQRMPKTRMDLFTWLRGRPAHNYFAFAVTGNQELRTTYSADVTMDDQAHEFTLVITIAYGITEPKLLVTRRNDDPLRKLREEVSAVLRRHIVRRDWQEIRYQFREVEPIVIAAAMEPLRQFAALYGFRIHDLSLAARLPESTYSDTVEMEAVEREKLHARLQEELHRTQISASDETGRLTDRLEHDRVMLRAAADAELDKFRDATEWERVRGRDGLASYRRRQQLYQAATDAGVTVLGKVAENITTVPQLNDAIRSFGNAMTELQIPGNGSGTLNPMPATGLIGAGQQGSVGVVGEMLVRTEQMRIGIDERTALRSALLHLAAEVMRGEEAAESAIATYTDRVVEAATNAALEQDDLEYVKRLLNINHLRNALS